MSKFLVKSIFLVALLSKGATMLFGGLVDTEGNAATNQTLLGNIDMGVGTLWDLKNFIFPYNTNAIPYAAISGTPDMSLKQDRLPYNTNAIPYSAITDTPNLALKQDKLPYDTNAIPYEAISGTPNLALKQDALPYPTSAIPYSVIADAPEGMTTNNVKDIVTNTVVVGYSDWIYTGDTSESQSYSITQAQSGDNYVFTLWDTKTSTALGTATTSDLNPLSLSFTITGGTIVATRSPLIRNALGLARYADVQALDDKIENMDTSYYRVVGITNKNQSVQYVETDANTTSLQIQMPESGMTKDWLVYVKALTNLTLVLPPADYWVVNEAVTNEIPPLVPTALYFSQIADNTYSIGRQELIPITVLSQRQIENNLIWAKMKKAGLMSRSAKKGTAPTSKVITK